MSELGLNSVSIICTHTMRRHWRCCPQASAGCITSPYCAPPCNNLYIACVVSNAPIDVNDCLMFALPIRANIIRRKICLREGGGGARYRNACRTCTHCVSWGKYVFHNTIPPFVQFLHMNSCSTCLIRTHMVCADSHGHS